MQHERALAAFMQWEYIEGQSTGDGFDFVANDNAKIEAKFDWGSIKTGNHFLEYSQTNDNMRYMEAIWTRHLSPTSRLLGRHQRRLVTDV
jgi:hypothetical protein